MASEQIIVDYTENLEKINLEEAYERIVAWIAKSGGKIDKKKTVRPNLIQAKHGSYRTISGWAKNAKKIMKFYLTPTETGTRVRLTIEPTLMNLQDVISGRREAERNWTELADELWLEFGFYGKSVIKEKSWGKAPKIRVLENEKRSTTNQVKWGFSLFLIIIVFFLAIQTISGWADEITLIFSIVLVWPTIMLMYGAIRFFQLRSKIRKLRG